MSACSRVSILLFLVPLLAACALGGWSQDEAFERGATVTLRGSSGSLTAELLLVDDGGVTVLADDALTRAEWAVLLDLQVKGRPAPRLRNGRLPSTEEVRELRLTSRYPFGLTDAQWARLRAVSGWDVVHEFR